MPTENINRDNLGNKPENQVEFFSKIENQYKSIEKLKNEVQLMSLKNTLNDKYEIVDMNTEDKEVYYVPVEDGKGNIVKYKAMYIDRDNPNEILRFPITDLEGNILRIQNIMRYKPMERPLFDPIDFIALGGGILKSFLKGLATLAPKTGINLSKTAIVKMGRGDLMVNVIGQEIPKDLIGNLVAQGVQE